MNYLLDDMMSVWIFPCEKVHIQAYAVQVDLFVVP